MDTANAGPWPEPCGQAGPSGGSAMNTAILCLIAALGYVILGELAFAIALQSLGISSIAFFPEGLALAFTILFGARVWPGLFAGQFMLSLLQGIPLSASGVIATANCLQAVLGGMLFWRWGISHRLNRPRDLMLFCALSGLVLQPISATSGVLTMHWLNGLPAESMAASWLSWWSSNIVGQLLLVPLILSWSRPIAPRFPKELRTGLLVVLLYLLSVPIVGSFHDGGNTDGIRLAFSLGFYLGIIWLAAHCSPRTISLTNLLMTIGLLAGFSIAGDLTRTFSIENRFLFANIFIFAGVVTALLISALLTELNEQKQELQKANAAKAVLFGVVAHDLRSPLASLHMLLESMMGGELTDEETREYQLALRRSLDNTVDALENLMEWGRLEIVAARPRRVPVPLRDPAMKALKLLGPIADDKRVRIENRLPDAATVLADPHQLQSIVRNLLSNAIKFTPEGGRITLSANREGNQWRVTVADTGFGMSPEQSQNLFNPAHHTTSSPGTANERGFGLGLRICSGFAQANNGTITVESTEGQGSLFHVLLESARTEAIPVESGTRLG